MRVVYNIFIGVVLGVVMTTLTSCGVAVKMCKQPELDLPEEIIAGQLDSLSLADVAWWEFYGDEVLVGFIEHALENNIYFQIGLVMLIGLVAKNAILIVEFAKMEMEKGVDAVTAAVTAARMRFRPIVMTSLAFILGLLPLVISSGPGAISRQGIGTGVFFGMCVAITLGIVYVPFFFVWIDRLKRKYRKK